MGPRRRTPRIGITRVVEESLAPTMRIMERTAWRHLARGHFLGMEFTDHAYRPQWGDGEPGFQGPVPDRPRVYLLPKGAQRGHIEVLPGPVSGEVYQGILTVEPRFTRVELVPSVGCSGVICQMWTHPLLADPVPYYDKARDPRGY